MLVPLSTFYGLGEPGATVTLRIHTHVREDVIALYGFATPLEQDLFERLIGDQRHRPEAGARGALGHRAGGAGPGDPAPGRRAADRDPRRRQEDRRADRPGAEGSAAADAAAGRAAAASAARAISCATTACRRCSISVTSVRSAEKAIDDAGRTPDAASSSCCATCCAG